MTLPAGTEPAAPAGLVTFLFTDIEGSTRLWDENPEEMHLALARHDALLREAIESRGGRVFKTAGDAFFAAFASAHDAFAAALAAQRALQSEPAGPFGSLWVRMALHTGPARERGGDFFGPALSRVARLLTAGNGGQVLVSQAAAEQIGGALPECASLAELGLHSLKDLLQPEHIFQLRHPDLRDAFPPLRSLQSFAHNLPVQLTSFVGREQELARAKQLLAQTRLLTMSGSGGCGKTRLALQLAAEQIEEFGDGAWLVELALTSDPALVPQAVASVLGVREEPGRPILQTLREHIHDRRLLLVLDNCEHLLSEVAALAEALLRACPRLRILASSRESLNIAGETVFRVPSLTVPDPRSVAATPETLNRYESARLFLDRAAAAAPAFTVSPANAPAVAQICHRLDGIPLAIELAAARVKVLPVEQIAARLDDRFRLLTGGSRTALPRQQTLRALIDWSYDLLPPAERALFQRLSVFVGGWTLEAAEAVAPGAADGPPDLVESWEVLDLLASLVDKSLVVAEEPGTTNHPGVRYRLLETVRQYGRDRLLEGGDAAAVRDRHLDYFTRLAEDADAKIRGPEQGTWLARLETEHDNLRAALQWCKSAADTGLTGLRLASALARFWEIRGHFTEGREHLSDVLAREDAAAASPERARALRAGGILASGQGDAAAARARFEDSLAILRAAGDRQGVAQTLNNMGLLALRSGDAAAAQALCEESLAMWRELGDPNGLAAALNNFANAAVVRGDYTSARAWYEEALHINRERGNRAGEAYNLNNLGDVAFRHGDADAALDFYRRSLSLLRELGDRHTIDALLDAFAAVAAAKGEWERSARLLGAADALREDLDVVLSPGDQAEHERQVAALRSALAETAFAAAWAAGRVLSPEQATALALGEDEA